MSCAASTQGGLNKACRMFAERGKLEDIGTDGRIILG